MIGNPTWLKVLASLLACASIVLPATVRAGDMASVVKVDLAAGGASQSLALPVGRSAVVDLPIDARDVLVSNPKVATAVLRTPRRIFVLGQTPGVTDAVFFDGAGRRILSLSIRVDQNTSALADTINRIIPGAQVKVEAINQSVILSGVVSNLADAVQGGCRSPSAVVDKPEQVLNMLSIAGAEQVMLKVRILEVDREVIKQLGFNWSAVINQAGNTQFLLSTATSYGVNGALLGGLTALGVGRNSTTQPEVNVFDPKTGQTVPVVCHTCPTATTQTTSGSSGINNASGNIQAFEQVGLVRTLAEPDLTAVSGESAKFLVGGSYPVPSSVSVTGQVSVEFKDFGVGLGFTPVVLSAAASR